VPVLGYILSGVTGYFLGSIPTGYLVAAARGIDIRTVGSGNIGATNVFRYLGVPAGIFVLLADAFKGWVAVIIATNVFLASSASGPAREWSAITAGLLAILGHNFTCWLHFKGGKGIATSAGVLLALVPAALLFILGMWILVFVSTRYVSLASICAAAALPVSTWLTGQSSTMICITAVMGGVAIYKHKANIQRLLKGTKNRVGGKKKPSVEAGPPKVAS
jgi:glycerol-3-phosphate acyltransferase PlsY